jgi:hypothetical protein
LQEYLAAQIGVKAGPYHQISDSWHAYLDTWNKQDLIPSLDNPYVDARRVWVYQFCSHPTKFDRDLSNFMSFTEPHDAGISLSSPGYINPFFYEIAIPMYSAWMAWKVKDFKAAYRELNKMPDRVDWRIAAEEWLARREKIAVGAGK